MVDGMTPALRQRGGCASDATCGRWGSWGHVALMVMTDTGLFSADVVRVLNNEGQQPSLFTIIYLYFTQNMTFFFCVGETDFVRYC